MQTSAVHAQKTGRRIKGRKGEQITSDSGRREVGNSHLNGVRDRKYNRRGGGVLGTQSALDVTWEPAMAGRTGEDEGGGYDEGRNETRENRGKRGAGVP